MPETAAAVVPVAAFADSFAAVDSEDLAALVLVGGFARVEELLDAHQDAVAGASGRIFFKPQ